MEICKYFSNEINITQNYSSGNHKKHSSSLLIFDYPIDDNYGSAGQTGYFLAPCTCKVVKKYSATTRQIWLTSVDKVLTPSGEYIVTFLVGHIDEYDFNRIKLNQVFTQGSKVCKESKDSKSTGYHNHVSCGLGTIKGTGWAKNKNDVWCLQTTLGVQKPEKVMFANDCKIKASGNLDWQIYDGNIYYRALDDLYIRTKPNGDYVLVKDCTEKMKNALKYQNPNDKAVIKKGTIITCLEVVTSGTSTWCKNYNGYVCIQGKKQYMERY